VRLRLSKGEAVESVAISLGRSAKRVRAVAARSFLERPRTAAAGGEVEVEAEAAMAEEAAAAEAEEEEEAAEAEEAGAEEAEE
jgi:hypothetical protein